MEGPAPGRSKIARPPCARSSRPCNFEQGRDPASRRRRGHIRDLKVLARDQAEGVTLAAEISVEGRLASLIEAPSRKVAAGLSGNLLVAEEGFEPPTHGL